MTKAFIFAMIICVFLFSLSILFFILSADNLDSQWVEADGDTVEAYRILQQTPQTPRDHLRNARIYSRTIRAASPRNAAEINRRAFVEYNAALHTNNIGIIAMVLDDFGDIPVEAGGAKVRHAEAVQRAREGVFAREVSRDEYLEQVQEWVDDGESVHDNKTSTGLRKILQRARDSAEPIGVADAAKELRDYIFDCSLDSKRKASALNVLAEICRSGYNATYDDDEPNILADIWARARTNENAKEAVAIALADGERKSGGIVCSTGRVGRVIASLDGIDPLMSGLSSSPAKIHRDKIFHEVQEALTRAKLSARASGHPEIADAYDGKAECDEKSPAYIAFAESLRAEIDAIVDKNSEIFRGEELERIREECYVIL